MTTVRFTRAEVLRAIERKDRSNLLFGLLCAH